MVDLKLDPNPKPQKIDSQLNVITKNWSTTIPLIKFYLLYRVFHLKQHSVFVFVFLLKNPVNQNPPLKKSKLIPKPTRTRNNYSQSEMGNKKKLSDSTVGRILKKIRLDWLTRSKSAKPSVEFRGIAWGRGRHFAPEH